MAAPPLSKGMWAGLCSLDGGIGEIDKGIEDRKTRGGTQELGGPSVCHETFRRGSFLLSFVPFPLSLITLDPNTNSGRNDDDGSCNNNGEEDGSTFCNNNNDNASSSATTTTTVTAAAAATKTTTTAAAVATAAVATTTTTTPVIFSAHRFHPESGNSARFCRNGTRIRRNDQNPVEWHQNSSQGTYK
jgi:hypothetical protein